MRIGLSIYTPCLVISISSILDVNGYIPTWPICYLADILDYIGQLTQLLSHMDFFRRMSI